MRQQVTAGWKLSGDGEAEDRLSLFWVEHKIRSKIVKVQSRKKPKSNSLVGCILKNK